MYGIYARQSVERQDSISIEMQIELCRERLPNCETAEIYADRGCTGTNTKRPEYQRMLADIRMGRLSGIILYKLDRISRSLLDFARLSEELEQHGVKLCSCREELDSGSPMGRMIIRMLIMFAEMEQQMISQRIRDNYKARAAKGLPLGGVPPYGYNRDWTVDPEKAATVRRIYAEALAGKSLDRIAQSLNESCVPSPENSRWSGQQVSRQLRNAVYVRCSEEVKAWLKNRGTEVLKELPQDSGILTVSRNDGSYAFPAAHTGIIEPEMWLAVQDILLSRKPSVNGGSGNTSWLQGLVLCGKCGSSCYVRGNGKGKPYVYFVCRGRRLGICSGLKALRTETAEKLTGRLMNCEIRRIAGKKRRQPDRELLRMTGGAAKSEITFSGWKRLSFSQKKAAAAVLVKNVIITEERVTVVLR